MLIFREPRFLNSVANIPDRHRWRRGVTFGDVQRLNWHLPQFRFIGAYIGSNVRGRVEDYALYERMKVVQRKAMEHPAVMAHGAEPPVVHRYPTRN